MADFKFEGLVHGQPVPRELMVSIAQLLDTNSIPNVAWGSFALTIYGVALCISDYSFIIPDEHIEKAREVLLAANFPPCPLGDACPRLHTDLAPAPYAHFNIKPESNKPTPTDWFTLELHKKSNLLWATPDIPLGAPALNDPNYMLVTDDCLIEYNPRTFLGRMSSTHHPLKVPTVARFAEAVAYLYYCDKAFRPKHYGSGWFYDVAFMESCPLLVLDDLEPCIRRHYELWQDDDNFQKALQYCAKVAAEMKEANEFPYSPFPPEETEEKEEQKST